MKKLLLIIFLLVALVFGCSKANKESMIQENTVIIEVVKTEWTIGEICPAGGTVFYDKGEETDGWKIERGDNGKEKVSGGHTDF